MNLLLHMCCAPCSIYPLQKLRDEGYAPDGYFFNPNIHPYKEFSRRLETAREFAGKIALTLHVDDNYDLEDFVKRAVNTDRTRCVECYELRLRQTAAFALANGYEAFTTTLLVSPYQQHDLIRETAERVAREKNLTFIYYDFREGWQEGVQICREMGLYRQPYCGCVFSERDRYYKKNKAKK